MTDDRSRSAIWYHTAAAVFLLLVLLRSPYFKSLWLDETITYWVIKDGLGELWSRTLGYQGQSPYYFVIVWGVTKLAGFQEWVLRLPSLLFGAGSIVLTFVLARRWLPLEGAWLAALLLVSINEVQGALFSARPYSLALMSALFSVYALLRWIDGASGKWRIAYVLSCLSMYYAHYLFGAALLVHLICFAVMSAGRRDLRWRRFLGLVAIWLIFCIPGLFQLGKLASSPGLYSFAPFPSPQGIVDALLPYRLLVCILCGFAGAVLFCGRALSKSNSFERKDLALLICWWVLPPVLFGLHAWSGGESLFLRRYFLWHAPALVILMAGCVSFLSSPRARRVFFFVSLLLLFGVEFSRRWVLEDWSGALRKVNRELAAGSVPVLFNSGLVELGNPEWLESRMNAAEASAYTLAPVSYYRLTQKPVLFPVTAGTARPGDDRSINLDRIFVQNRELLVVCPVTVLRVDGRQVSLAGVLLESLKSRGFSAQSLGDFGVVGAWRLTRAAASVTGLSR